MQRVRHEDRADKLLLDDLHLCYKGRIPQKPACAEDQAAVAAQQKANQESGRHNPCCLDTMLLCIAISFEVELLEVVI